MYASIFILFNKLTYIYYRFIVRFPIHNFYGCHALFSLISLDSSCIPYVFHFYYPVYSFVDFNKSYFKTKPTCSQPLINMSNVATGFNQRKLPHRTICVPVDLTVAFDTVNHNVLLVCYQIWQDQRFLRQPVDGCGTTSEAGNQLQAAEA